MKTLNFWFTMVILALVIGCGSSEQTTTKTDDGWSEIEDPFRSLTNLANRIIEEGGVAALGQGISRRSDIAREKARTNADGALAEIFSKKVDRLKKNFREEVGQGNQSEINELFSVVTKTLTSKVLTGAIEKDYKVLHNDKGFYKYGVVMAISPKTINMSLMDEMSSGKPQLYQRFRASKAFEELKKEIEEYEKKEQQGF